MFSVTDPIIANAASIPSSIGFVPVVSGLTKPVLVTNAGDSSNRLFIVQQTGQIRIFKNGNLLATPFLNISGLVSNFTGVNGEQGFLGLAFDPNYATNGIFYVTYTTNTNDATFPYTTTLARYHVSNGNPDVADTTSGHVLLSIPKKYTNHNGGMISFGPDGYLYFSMGDGGSGGDPDNNAQNLHSLLGKLLRLDVHTTPPAGKEYVIPSTNPFFGSNDPNLKKEIWSYGLRNPWRFSFDRLTGDLYIGDVGQDVEEEVDFQAHASSGGQNYGWRIREGNLCYNPATNCVNPSGYVPPVATYDHGTNHSFGCSLTGGYIYRGSQFPSLQGVYFYGDFCSGKLLALIKNANNTWSSSLITSTSYSISGFGEDEQGELYLCDYSAGKVYHISNAVVTISGSAGVSGVSLGYTDGTQKTTTSLDNGNYSFQVPVGWSGTVTPSHVCLNFTPVSLSYNTLTIDQSNQDYSYSLHAGCSKATVSIATTNRGIYAVPTGGLVTPKYPGVQTGPVKVSSTLPVFASERALFGPYNTFNEVMGVPDNQLTDHYWFPWYDNKNMTTWILVANPSDSLSANVTIKIGGQQVYSRTLAHNATDFPQFQGVQTGPVEVSSSIPIITSERSVSGPASSFNEVMGVPDNRLSDHYWFPWYDNKDMTTWILVANPSDSLSANVTIKVGGQQVYSQTLGHGEIDFPQFQGVQTGPVEVSSNIPVITSERSLFGRYNTFNEVMGIPDNQLSDHYWFPWYDDKAMTTWILVGNPSNSLSANVTIKIGGQQVYSQTLGHGEIDFPQFQGVQTGPVEVSSSIPIITSERALFGPASSFNEVPGYPDNQLTTDYWFPWYDDKAMTTWVLVSNP